MKTKYLKYKFMNSERKKTLVIFYWNIFETNGWRRRNRYPFINVWMLPVFICWHLLEIVRDEHFACISFQNYIKRNSINSMTRFVFKDNACTCTCTCSWSNIHLSSLSWIFMDQIWVSCKRWTSALSDHKHFNQ